MSDNKIRSEILGKMWSLRKRIETYDIILAEDDLREIESLISDNSIEDERVLKLFNDLKQNLVVANDALWNPWHGDALWSPWHGAP